MRYLQQSRRLTANLLQSKLPLLPLCFQSGRVYFQVFGDKHSHTAFASAVFDVKRGHVVIQDAQGISSWAPTPSMGGRLAARTLPSAPLSVRLLLPCPMHDIFISVLLGQIQSGISGGMLPVAVFQSGLQLQLEFSPVPDSDASAQWEILSACMNPWNDELLTACSRTDAEGITWHLMCWGFIRDKSTGALHTLKKWETCPPHDAHIIKCINYQSDASPAAPPTQSLIAVITTAGDMVVWDCLGKTCFGWIEASSFGTCRVSACSTDTSGKILILVRD